MLSGMKSTSVTVLVAPKRVLVYGKASTVSHISQYCGACPNLPLWLSACSEKDQFFAVSILESGKWG